MIQDAYDTICLSFNKIINNDDELNKFIKQLQESNNDILLCTSSRAYLNRSVHIENTLRAPIHDVINIHNLVGIRNKGWASDKRIKSIRKKANEAFKYGSKVCNSL